MVQTLSLILLLIFSDVVDSLLGTFAEALDTKNFLVARGILDKKLSMPNQSQEYVTFLTVINRKPWDEIESVINCCGPCKIIPLSFYLTKDTQNTTLFHTLAKEPKSIELMQNIFCQDQDLAIKEVIVTKTRSLPTPLEVAINKKNFEFISKSLLKTHSGYLYYIDGYKKWNRSSQTTVIDIKRTTLKNAIEWHWSHTSEIRGLSTIFNFTPKKHKIRKVGYFQLA